MRASIQGEIARLEHLIAARERPTDAQLVQIAATLIGVEDRLDDQLVGLILPRPVSGQGGAPVEEDFQQVQSAVLRECIVNLARVKEYVTQNVGGTLDSGAFDTWQELMRGIQAGLLMLGKSRAVDVVERVSQQLRRVMQPGGQGLAPHALDRLADAIVSTEYYMETLQSGRSDPWYMLDNAESALDALDKPPTVPTVPAANTATLRTLGAGDAVATELLPPPAGAAPVPKTTPRATPPAAACRCCRPHHRGRSSPSTSIPISSACSSKRRARKWRASSSSSPCGTRTRWMWKRWSTCGAPSTRSRAAVAWSARASSASFRGASKT